MKTLFEIILYSFFSGITVLLGGILAHVFEESARKGLIRSEITHLSIAFGGGILLAAVGLVLVPRGIEQLPLIPMSMLFLSGAFLFFFLDRYLERKGGTVSQLMAMLLDFVPESIALGAVFATDPKLGLLLAIFIGIQNLPESFNAYLELRKGGLGARKGLVIMSVLSTPGILGAIAGYYLLSSRPTATAALMLFSSGGIIYLIFQDIAPMSKMKKDWIPALGASLGFLIGMIGLKVLG